MAEEKKPELPPAEFSTFVVSLVTSAHIHLGLIDDPNVGKAEVNLPHARYTIDILGMLQTKTSGNLTKEEGDLLENLLHELRVKYVEKSKDAK